MSRSFHIETDDQRKRLFTFLGARELPFQVDFGPIKEQRSLAANARLWKLHGLVAKETGNSAEDMHEEALCRFFGFTEKRMPTGWIKRIPLKRSSQREPKEFSELMESTEAWYATDFGIWLGQENVWGRWIY
jgi:hypothetical protein